MYVHFLTKKAHTYSYSNIKLNLVGGSDLTHDAADTFLARLFLPCAPNGMAPHPRLKYACFVAEATKTILLLLDLPLLAFFHRIVMRTNILYVRRRCPVLCIRGYAVRERGGGDLLFFLGKQGGEKNSQWSRGRKILPKTKLAVNELWHFPRRRRRLCREKRRGKHVT